MVSSALRYNGRGRPQTVPLWLLLSLQAARLTVLVCGWGTWSTVYKGSCSRGLLSELHFRLNKWYRQSMLDLGLCISTSSAVAKARCGSKLRSLSRILMVIVEASS
jgi:hypothetical protein